jgi:hydroxyacylglutathione hydrolase
MVTAFDIVTLETPSLGDRSYLVTDGFVAAVIDPQRDIARVTDVVEHAGLDITHVLETHIHNDYVTGGLDLARARNAAYLVADREPVGYERTPVAEGDEVTTGELTICALHTPGHTPHHLSYVASYRGRARAVFTGGSMLFGSVGRTDLLGAELTDELSRAQWHSVRRLAGELDGAVVVCPTHGFGSFCSSTSGTGPRSGTIADQRDANLALLIDDEDVFVDRLRSGLTAYPAYYSTMGPINRNGPPPLDLTPPAAIDADAVARHMEEGHPVVDVRARRDFAAEHVAGTVGIELHDSFATYVGWLLPWGEPLVLLGDSADDLAAAQLSLSRIGIDHLGGWAAGGVRSFGRGREIRSYRVGDFAALALELCVRGVAILDVRRDDEWEAEHIEGAVHIPLHTLMRRSTELPDTQVWVYCSGGFRSSIAASLLDRAGFDVVLVDDSFDRAEEAGLPIVP